MSRFPLWLFAVVILATGAGLWVGYQSRQFSNSADERSQGRFSILTPTGVFEKSWVAEYQRLHQTSLKVHEVATAEELTQALENHPEAYDVALLFSYQALSHAQQTRLNPIDPSRLRFGSLVSPDFWQRSGDTTDNYHVPLFWGLNGFAYDRSKWKEPLQSWAQVWAQSKAVFLLNSTVDLFHLMSLRSPQILNGTAQEDDQFYRRPFLELLQSVQLVPAWLAPHPLPSTASVVQMSHHQALQFGEGSNWSFVLPEDKSLLWVLGMSLVKGTRIKDREMYKFLDSFLQREVALGLSRTNGFASVNRSLEDSPIENSLKPSYIRSIPLNRVQALPSFELGSALRKLIGNLENSKPQEKSVNSPPPQKPSSR